MAHKPVLPPSLFMAAAVAAVGLHFALPLVSLIHFPYTISGIVLILFGAVLNIWADQLFKRHCTTVKPFERPSSFVREGPFAWTRHPMYPGMVALLLGIAVTCGSLSSFIPALVFWLIVRLHFIPAEERSMADTFGDEYSEYRRRVWSWI